MKTQIKKLIILCFCCGILVSIGVIPEILISLFPSSETFAALSTTIRPYSLYVIMPILMACLLYTVVVIGRMNVKPDKSSDIVKGGLLILGSIFLSVLMVMILHLILSKYAQNYSGALWDIKGFKLFIFGGAFFVLILCGYSYGKFLGRHEKGINIEDINALIKKGESLTLEFKQTFFMDVKKKHEEEYIKKESLKNIAGFLNKDGGTLLIGVCDNGDIYGIENDNYKSDDDYLKRFKDIVKTNFIPSVLNLIHYEIVVIDNKKVLRIDCPRSDELIFLKGELDWAYVRTNPAVEKISGAALVDYARMREKEKEKKSHKI